MNIYIYIYIYIYIFMFIFIFIFIYLFICVHVYLHKLTLRRISQPVSFAFWHLRVSKWRGLGSGCLQLQGVGCSSTHALQLQQKNSK